MSGEVDKEVIVGDDRIADLARLQPRQIEPAFGERLQQFEKRTRLIAMCRHHHRRDVVARLTWFLLAELQTARGIAGIILDVRCESLSSMDAAPLHRSNRP